MFAVLKNAVIKSTCFVKDYSRIVFPKLLAIRCAAPQNNRLGLNQCEALASGKKPMARYHTAIAAPLILMLASVNPAHASQTTTWTTGAAPVSTTTNGVTVTVTSSIGFGAGTANGNMGATNFWNTPYSGSIVNANDLNFTVNNVATQTITVTFNQPVANPVFHLKRFGGSVGTATNSSRWLLSGSNLGTLPTVSRLSGNPQFRVDATGFYRAPNATVGATGCSVASATASTDDGSNACGSVRINGRGITSLTFTVSIVGPAGGDGVEMVVSVADPTLAVQKVTTNGFGGLFNFTATNLAENPDSISTTAANTLANAVPVPDIVTTVGSQIAVTETATAGFSFTSASCRDTNSAVTGQTGTFGTVSGSTITVPASRVVSDAVLLCTFTNAALPNLSVAKSAPSPTLAVGTNSTYTLTVTNTGPGAATTVQIKDQLPTGMTFVSAAGTDWTCANASGLVTCNYANATGIARINGTATVSVVVTPTVAIAGTSVTNYASVDPTGGAAAPTPGAGCAPAAACASNVATVTSFVVATPDSVSGVNGATGSASVVNVLTGDTINGAAATTGNSTLSVAPGFTVPSNLTFNTATGAVGVNPNTPAGTYTFTYQICETANPTNCRTASVSVTVAPSVDLRLTKTNTPGVNGEVDQASDTLLSGATTTYTLVVTNNGPDAAIGALVRDTVGTGLTCPGTNAVTITGNGVPSGSFTVADLTSPGITLGTLASGQSASFSYSCTVN
jgi:uncharacterized repeat protein (TIGR01451 family)